MMRIATLACVALTVGQALALQRHGPLARTVKADRSQMFMVKENARDGTNICTTFLPGETPEFTFVVWAAFAVPAAAPFKAMPMTFFSYEDAREVSEGGDHRPGLLNGMGPLKRLPLSAGGTWARQDLLPPTSEYDVPECLVGQIDGLWDDGCYTANVVTDSDLTITIGGVERQVSASNAMQRVTVNGCAADRSVTVAASSPSATVDFDLCVSPLRQFLGANLFAAATDSTSVTTDHMITNEWRMLVLRGRIEPGGASLVHSGTNLGWDSQAEEYTYTETRSLWHPRTNGRFARNSRLSFTAFSLGGIKDSGGYYRRNAWGAKLFRTWLTDDEIYAVRDADVAEMLRRGMSRHVQFGGD